VIALGLAAAAAWRVGRPRAALACGVGCALLRVEAWPFLLAAGIVMWRRRPADRWLLVTCAVALPALWLVPEWLGSGDVLRSGSRARIPNPCQPALADIPAWASLREALALPLWPLGAGALAALALPAARAVMAAGFAWIGLVAAMAQAGFSGEPRYALPGAALVSIAAAAGLVAAVRRVGGAPWPRATAAASSSAAAPSPATASSCPAAASSSSAAAPSPATASLWSGPAVRASSAAAALAAAAILVAAAPRLADLPDLRRSQAWQRGLAADLEAVVRAAGGREVVLACGRPYVGELRGPLLAYHLDVEKRRVGFEPEPPGIVFRSRLHAGDPVEPATGPPFRRLARDRRWEVRAAC
jgi:hypothetical protein